MRTVALGRQGLEVSELGIGCMVMSGMYRTPDPEESIATFQRAVELGITLFDTADSYSAGENERFVGTMLGAGRPDLVVATKFGLVRLPDGTVGADGRPEYARAACDASLQRLGIDDIDLYYLHRVDPRVPVEESVGAMAELVAAGKVRYLGICEVSGDELKRAHATHPITAVQSEWSLFARGIERECLSVARELGIGVVPYAPLGRGFFAGAITAPSSFTDADLRAGDPRFSEENLPANLRLLEVVADMARAKEATPAQLALAWLCAQGDDVVPIPGTEQRVFLEENVGALALSFTAEELTQLDEAFPIGVAAGNPDHVLMRDLAVHDAADAAK
jgi:aryl-alcohol dehydrogenase-like predicted oxidoreductase